MRPSPTELVILKHPWRTGAQSIGEIHAAAQDPLDWSRSSSRKTVERMVEKGLLDYREQHGLSIYRAKAKKIPTLAGLIRSFASDVLDLDGPLPVSNLIETRLLDAHALFKRWSQATEIRCDMAVTQSQTPRMRKAYA